MKLQLAFLALVLVVSSANAEQGYAPPSASADLLKSVPWSSAHAVGDKFRSRFQECETKNSCDGQQLKYGCKLDPNNNTALFHLPKGVVFFDGKMGLDADGSPYSRKTPGQTDRPETAFRYEVPGRPSADSDKVPFIVIPQGGFGDELGIEIGDVAMVVYERMIAYALVADAGPKCKIGEGSIQLHEELGHRVCLARDSQGECTRLRNAGIEKGVLYFIFPKSKISGLTPENARKRIFEEGERLSRELRGVEP
jgi:hypothetical protein